jgi:hypothetical protein
VLAGLTGHAAQSVAAPAIFFARLGGGLGTADAIAGSPAGDSSAIAGPMYAPCLALTAVMLLASGCARVPPHQRDTLARRDMHWGAFSDLAAGEEHGMAYREGSTGGMTAVNGGGCGCN